MKEKGCPGFFEAYGPGFCEIVAVALAALLIGGVVLWHFNMLPW